MYALPLAFLSFDGAHHDLPQFRRRGQFAQSAAMQTFIVTASRLA
jgi:hypothetical protein